MHPDPVKADCKSKEEKISKQKRHFDRALGFVSLVQLPGDEENKRYFGDILAKYPQLVDEPLSVLWWLSKQKPDSISRGFTVLPLSKLNIRLTPLAQYALHPDLRQAQRIVLFRKSQ